MLLLRVRVGVLRVGADVNLAEHQVSAAFAKATQKLLKRASSAHLMRL